MPAASLARARTVCKPLASGLGSGKLQLPEPSAVVVPTELPSIKMFTVLPGSAVPVTVGWALFVTEPLAGVITTGAGGGVVSIVQV